MAEAAVESASPVKVAAPAPAVVVGRPDSHQRLRQRRALLGMGSAALYSLCLWVLHSVGLYGLQATALLVLAGLWLAGFGVVVALLASGRNRTWRDPSATLPQVLWANAGVVVLAQFAGAFEPLLLGGALVSLMFASLRLAVSRSVVATVVTLVYLAAAALISLFALPRSFDATFEILQFGGFTLLAVLTTVVGFEVNGLRTALLRRNEDVNKAFERLRSLSVTDELTGIRNRRYLLDAMQHQKALVERGEHIFSICYVDLDHFERINDVFGRNVGDAVLKAFADIGKACVREVDFVARLEGEEFVLVLVGTPVANAQVVAERMRAMLAELVVSELIPEFRVTASVGLTQFRLGEAVEATLTRADRALHDARDQGRDRIVLIPEDDTGERRSP